MSLSVLLIVNDKYVRIYHVSNYFGISDILRIIYFNFNYSKVCLVSYAKRMFFFFHKRCYFRA